MYTTVNVDVDVDLGDFDTEDLVEELENRGVGGASTAQSTEMLEKIWLLRRMNKPFEAELDQLLWLALGKTL